MRNLLAVLSFMILGLGCRGVTITPLVTETYPPHKNKICILPHAPPEGLEYVAIADVRVELNSYGGDRKAKAGLAKQARKIGADAIVSAVFTNSMGAPNGEGQAIVYTNNDTEPPADCEWY